MPTDLQFDAWFENHVQPLIDACPTTDSHILNSVIELEWARAVSDIIRKECITQRISPMTESYALFRIGERMGQLRLSRHTPERQATLDHSRKYADIPYLTQEAHRIVTEAVIRHHDSPLEIAARFDCKLLVLRKCVENPFGKLISLRTGINPQHNVWRGIFGELVEDGYLKTKVVGGYTTVTDYYITRKGRKLLRCK